MQSILFLGLILGLSARSSAADFLPRDTYKQFNCRSAVQTELKKSFAKTQPHWERTADPDFETHAYRTPTAKTGEWFEFRVTDHKVPSLHFYSLHGTRQFSWGEKCKMAVKSGSGIEFNKSEGTEAFTDGSLETLLNKKTTALIYVWSPRMTYSVTEFSRMQELAHHRKMEFIPVLDPMADLAEAKAAMDKNSGDIHLKSADAEREPQSVSSFQQLGSVELYMRNATLHFPTAYLVSNGKIHSTRLVGVLTNDDLNQTLDQMTKELKK